jgi:hypothetical protein
MTDYLRFQIVKNEPGDCYRRCHGCHGAGFVPWVSRLLPDLQKGEN